MSEEVDNLNVSIDKIYQRRKQNDLMQLVLSHYEVGTFENFANFEVKLHGPPGTPYARGVWWVRVSLPDIYPFKSPRIVFVNKIYHPNVDEADGCVCFDVINRYWSVLFDLHKIFDTFLPQLLMYPNATKPLNEKAGALFLRDRRAYGNRVQEYIQRWGIKEVPTVDLEDPDSPCESSLSDYSDSDD